jgi:hypothetical protein
LALRPNFLLDRFFFFANKLTRCPKGPHPGLSASSSVLDRRGAEMEDEGEPEIDEEGV